MKTGAELFVDAIERHGIREIFTLVGDHLNDVLMCAGQRGLRIIDMRHEAAVVHAADAWARIHRRPALSLVTGGPGHTNALTGVATAFLAGSPVITVSGSRASVQAQRGAFQDIDQMGMIRPVVKWAAEPASVTQIPYFVGRAFAEATAGRPGPVHLTIPVDLFAGKTDKAIEYAEPAATFRPAPDTGDIERAVAMLQAARRPVIIVGSGAWWSGAEEELRAFAERTQIPVFTITLARGIFPDDHPLGFGYADPSLNRAAARALTSADVALVVGKRIDFRLALGAPRVLPEQLRIIQVDIHAAELGINRRIDVPICADAKSTLGAMLTASRRSDTTEWLAQLQSFRDEWQSWLNVAADDTSSPMHPAAFYRELKQALPAEILYSWDGGDFAHWGRAMLQATKPGSWMRLGPLATIGAALPNGLALQMANPDKPVVVITGDGSLGFYIAELDTAVRHNLPIVVIVGNDAGWGLERELQGRDNTVGCELRPTRYDIVMQGFGGEGESINSVTEVGPAVERAFAARKPYLLNVNIRGERSPFTRWKLGDG